MVSRRLESNKINKNVGWNQPTFFFEISDIKTCMYLDSFV